MAKSDTEETPKKKKSKLKWFILILFILLILGGGAAGAWFFFLAEKFQGKAEGDAAGASGHSETTTAAQQPIGTTIALPEFTVNLADPLGQRFIKISIEVEVSEPKVAQEMDRQKARIRDSVIMLLSSKSFADLATTESKIMLKSEITARLTSILGSGKVFQVFITDIVIQ